MKIEPPALRRLIGEESIHNRGASYSDSFGGATVADFWRWAFSNLCLDEIRGPFAEFIVARLLGEHAQPRVSWPYDFRTSTGLGIEVKSAAYLQNWQQRQHTTIRFSGLKSRLMSPGSGFAVEMKCHADVYLFCVLTTKDSKGFDPLDLDQWDFYVLSRAGLEKIIGASDTISLSTLKKYVNPCTAYDLKRRVSSLSQNEEPTKTQD